MMLSKNFSLEEFTKSQTAERRGIYNVPPTSVRERLKALCENVLQPLRDHLGYPIVVNSGYRSPELNRAIGGSLLSQNMQGEAADIECPMLATDSLAETLYGYVESFDQLILEGHHEGQPHSGWVHVSWKPGRCRNEFLGWNALDGYWRIK